MSVVVHNLSGLGLVSWAKADAYLGTRESKRVVNNTILHRLPSGDIALRHFDTDIVTYHRGSYDSDTYPGQFTMTLRTGGWYSVTTKERLNAVLGALGRSQGAFGVSLGSEKGVWYYYPPMTATERASDAHDDYRATWDSRRARRVLFFDGLQIDSEGMPLNARGPETSAAERAAAADTRTLNAIRRYVQAITPETLRDSAASEAGDCWYCKLRSQTGQPLGEMAGTQHDHLREHLKDGYLPYNLIVNAYRDQRYGDPMLVLSLDWEHASNGSFSLRNIKRNVRKYLVSRLIQGPRTLVTGTHRTATKNGTPGFAVY